MAFLCPPSRAGASSHWPGTGPALAVPCSATAAALITSDRPPGEDSASSRPRPPALKAALVPVFWGLRPWHHLGEAARVGRRWGAEAGAGPHRDGPREPQGVAAEGERGSQRHRGRGALPCKVTRWNLARLWGGEETPAGLRGSSRGGVLAVLASRPRPSPHPPRPVRGARAAAGGAGRPSGRATGETRNRRRLSPSPSPATPPSQGGQPPPQQLPREPWGLGTEGTFQSRAGPPSLTSVPHLVQDAPPSPPGGWASCLPLLRPRGARWACLGLTLTPLREAPRRTLLTGEDAQEEPPAPGPRSAPARGLSARESVQRKQQLG